MSWHKSWFSQNKFCLEGERKVRAQFPRLVSTIILRAFHSRNSRLLSLHRQMLQMASPGLVCPWSRQGASEIGQLRKIFEGKFQTSRGEGLSGNHRSCKTDFWYWENTTTSPRRPGLSEERKQKARAHMLATSLGSFHTNPTGSTRSFQETLSLPSCFGSGAH